MASTNFITCIIVSAVLILAIGAVLAALGIWSFVDDYRMIQLGSIEHDGKYSDDMDKPGLLETAAVIAIVDGVLTMLIAVFTFLGIWHQARCILGLCAAFLVVMLMLDIIIIILCGVSKERTDDHLADALFDSLRFQYEGIIASSNDFSRLLDVAQVTFECCGVNASSNALVFSETWIDKYGLQVPKTCCKLKDKDFYLESDGYDFFDITCARDLSLDLYHAEPCAEHIRDWLEEKIFTLIGWTVVSFVFQLVAILLDISIISQLSDGGPAQKVYPYK